MFNFIDISIFIPVIGCVGKGTSVLICPGAYNAVKTVLNWTPKVKQTHRNEREATENVLQRVDPATVNNNPLMNSKLLITNLVILNYLHASSTLKKFFQYIDNASGCDIRLFWRLILRQWMKMVKLKIVPKEHDQKTTRMQNNKDFIRFRSLYSEGKSFVIWTYVNNRSKPQSAKYISK